MAHASAIMEKYARQSDSGAKSRPKVGTAQAGGRVWEAASGETMAGKLSDHVVAPNNACARAIANFEMCPTALRKA